MSKDNREISIEIKVLFENLRGYVWKKRNERWV